MNNITVTSATSEPIDFCKLVASMSDQDLDQLTLQNPPDLDFIKHFAACSICCARMNQVFIDSFEKLGPGMGKLVFGLIESTSKNYIERMLQKKAKEN